MLPIRCDSVWSCLSGGKSTADFLWFVYTCIVVGDPIIKGEGFGLVFGV